MSLSRLFGDLNRRLFGGRLACDVAYWPGYTNGPNGYRGPHGWTEHSNPPKIRILRGMGAETERRTLLHEMCHVLVGEQRWRGTAIEHGPEFCKALRMLEAQGEARAGEEAEKFERILPGRRARA